MFGIVIIRGSHCSEVSEHRGRFPEVLHSRHKQTTNNSRTGQASSRAKPFVHFHWSNVVVALAIWLELDLLQLFVMLPRSYAIKYNLSEPCTTSVVHVKSLVYTMSLLLTHISISPGFPLKRSIVSNSKSFPPTNSKS